MRTLKTQVVDKYAIEFTALELIRIAKFFRGFIDSGSANIIAEPIERIEVIKKFIDIVTSKTEKYKQP